MMFDAQCLTVFNKIITLTLAQSIRTVLNERAALRLFLTLTLISIVASSVLEIHAGKCNANIIRRWSKKFRHL